MSVFLCYCGAQNWILYSRCSLISAEQKGRITSLNLLATGWRSRNKVTVTDSSNRRDQDQSHPAKEMLLFHT